MGILNRLSKLNHCRLNLRHARQLSARKNKMRSFGGHVKYLTVETQQGLFLLDPADAGVSRALMVDGGYGLSEIEIMKEFIGESSNVILLGGHIGSIAIPLSKYCKKMHVFEANPENYKLLKLNARLNNCSNINLHNIAISNKPAKLDFLVHEGNSGASRIRPLSSYEPVAYEKAQSVSVISESLDNFFAADIFDIDLLFMDIEGSEYYAVDGARSILQRTKTLITEFVPSHFKLVAGVSPLDFWSIIKPYFATMLIPNEIEGVYHGAQAIEKKITKIYRDDISFDNIIFSNNHPVER